MGVEILNKCDPMNMEKTYRIHLLILPSLIESRYIVEIGISGSEKSINVATSAACKVHLLLAQLKTFLLGKFT